jgi:hypothetical protein
MSANGTMSRRAEGSAAMNYAAVAVAVGGLLGLAGVYLNWFRYGYDVPGGTITFHLGGFEDWTGQVAFIAGIAAFAFAIAHVLLADPQIRRLTGALMGIAAVLLLAACIAAFFRVDAVTEDPLVLGAEPGTPVVIAVGVSGGLLVSALGGIFAVVGALLSLRPPGTYS